ncbi:hypothetical protein [Rhodoferax sp.]|uniref:hypothetical protein n=1 Tax=Rhodoferax sp. TaxID=50421 RepID=UPI00284B8CB9|nr:hypothetical protein [Rhodoferax sp.]MDR3369378.1 hypothetical protein [Rhodoferax sp.]
MISRFWMVAISTVLGIAISGCGGGGGGSSPAATIAIQGTAASGSSLSGLVSIKDSTGKTANTSTDSNGNYQFTTTQLSGMTAPYMLEIDYKIGGVDYYLNSAATQQDLSSGPATINITPLTDLIVANLAHEIATNVFNNGNFSSILTPAALSAGSSALAAQLQPLLAAQGLSGTVDLLHQSFTANTGTGLDGVLDALQVTVDPATQRAILTNRLNNTSITNDLTVAASANTSTLTTNNAVPMTDLQAVTADFNAFSVEMAKAPTETDPALLAFFDQTNFKHNGQSLAQFLQQITTDPTVVGLLAFANITLDTVPSWVTTVPTGATAYKVHFTVLQKNMPSSREEFIVYKSTSGSWLLLGNQKIAKANVNVLETYGMNGSSQQVYCTGLNPNIAIKGGSTTISFAVVTGPGLPSGGLLLFNSGANSGNGTDFIIADPASSYNGANTTQWSSNTSTCGYSSLYPLSDAAIQSTTAPIAAGTQYTIKLYNDNGQSNISSLTTLISGSTLVATYKPTLFAAPLLNSQVNPSRFPMIGSGYQNQLTTVIADANAATVQMFTAHWTAPTAPDLYASNVWLNISSATTFDNASVNVLGDATSASLAIPLLANTIHANATLEYNDSSFRIYWSNYYQ